MKKEFSPSVVLAGLASVVITGCATSGYYSDHPTTRAGLDQPAGHVRVEQRADMRGIQPADRAEIYADRPFEPGRPLGVQPEDRLLEPVPPPRASAEFGARTDLAPDVRVDVEAPDARVDVRGPGAQVDVRTTPQPFEPDARLDVRTRTDRFDRHDATMEMHAADRNYGYGQGAAPLPYRQNTAAGASDEVVDPQPTSRVAFSPLTDTIHLSTWSTRFPMPLMSIDTYTFRAPAQRYPYDPAPRASGEVRFGERRPAEFRADMAPDSPFYEPAGAAPTEVFRHTPNQR